MTATAAASDAGKGVTHQKSPLPTSIETEEQLKVALRLSSDRKRNRAHRQFKKWKSQNPVSKKLSETALKEIRKAFSSQCAPLLTEERRQLMSLWASTCNRQSSSNC